MIKIILAVLVIGLVIVSGLLVRLRNEVVNHDDIGIFKIGTCYRREPIGVTYRYTANVKGRASMVVVASEKEPEKYGLGQRILISAYENPDQLTPVGCPEKN